MTDTLTTQSATPATIPASTVIATDDAGAGGHVQIVKLAISTDGSATALQADNTDGLLVNLGANNDVTVTGSVTANAGTNLNTSTLALESGGNLAAAATSLAALDNAVAGNELQVDIVSSALPSGASTLAEQQTQTTALQLIDDAVYTDGTGTPSKAIGVAGTDGTNPQIIKTDASGELQVDVLTMPTVTVTDGSGSLTVDGTVTANLAAGTNNIGDVDILTIAAGDNNIGNVDIASAIPAGDNAIGRVKITDGTDVALVDGSGNLMVNVAAGGAGDGSILDGVDTGIKATVLDYTNSNPLAVRLTDTSGDYVGAGAGTQYTEDAAAAANPVGTALMLVREDGRAGSLTTTDGDNVAARGNNKGELYVKTTDSDALLTTIDADTGNISTKIDTLAGAVSGTEMQVDVLTLPNVTIGAAIPAGTNNIGDVDVLSIVPGTGATNLGKAIDTATGATDTGVLALATRDDALSALTPIEGDNVQLRTDANGALWTHDDALDAALSGSELQVDVVAALPAGTNNIGDVDILSIAAGDNNIGNVDIVTLPALAAGTNAVGKLLPPDTDITAHTNYAKKYYTSTGAATDGIIWSPAAGKRWHVVSMYLNVSAAATVTLEDDKAGGDEAIWKGEYAANSGVTIYFGEQYPLASGEDAADLIITTSAGNVYVTVTGYEV